MCSVWLWGSAKTGMLQYITIITVLPAQSSRVDVLLLFHLQIWEDKNFGYFTWPQAIEDYKIWSQMGLHFFLKTKHGLSC